MTTRIEVDATENRLDKPHNISGKCLPTYVFLKKAPRGPRGIVLRNRSGNSTRCDGQGALSRRSKEESGS